MLSNAFYIILSLCIDNSIKALCEREGIKDNGNYAE